MPGAVGPARLHPFVLTRWTWSTRDGAGSVRRPNRS